MKVELLDATHDRDAFDCGVPALDRYLRETARQHISKGTSKTYVAVDPAARPPRPIHGFFTLSICQVLATDVPEAWARKLPNHTPALRLGRLAVASAHRGKGLGQALVIEAMIKSQAVAQVIGGIGLFVDAKDERAAAFYERLGFERAPRNLVLCLPMQTIERLLMP